MAEPPSEMSSVDELAKQLEAVARRYIGATGGRLRFGFKVYRRFAKVLDEEVKRERAGSVTCQRM